MKKILLLFLFAATSGFLFAQGSLQLFDHDGVEVINGQNIDVFVEDVSITEAVSPELFVKNNSDSDISLKCLRTIVSEVTGTMNYFCALGTCLAPSIDETPSAFNVPANTMIGEEGVFSSHYMPLSNPGTTVLSYKFYDVNNTDDYIEFTVTFSSEATAESSLQLFDHEGGEITNGSNIDVIVDDLSIVEAVSPELFVKNNADVDIDLKCLRTVIQDVEGTMNYFCALGTCLAPHISETPNTYTVPANSQVAEEGVFSAHYMPLNIAGTAVFSYKFYDVNNTNDTISFTVTFIGEQQASGPSMQLFTADQTEIMNGHIFEVNIDDLNGEIESPDLFVKNNSDSDINVLVRRDIISEVEGSLNYFCALGTCLSPEIDELTREYLLESGTTVGEEGVFYAHYSPMGNEGLTKIRYKFFNNDDATDTISFEVHFDAAQGLSDLDNQNKITVYPNPATHSVHFNLENVNVQNARLVLYNAVGKETLSKFVFNSKTISLDISELPRGVYLYRLEGDFEMSKTFKLVIQ